MEELKVTKERVLEAAKSCSQAKDVLEKLFPEAFEETYYTGQRFEIKSYSNILQTMWECNNFILAQIDAGVINLISLTSGNRFGSPCFCKNVSKVTKKELESIVYQIPDDAIKYKWKLLK